MTLGVLDKLQGKDLVLHKSQSIMCPILQQQDREAENSEADDTFTSQGSGDSNNR